MAKSSVDTQAIQNWIISNTEKMLRYKDLQLLIDQEIEQKRQVEEQISEEQGT